MLTGVFFNLSFPAPVMFTDWSLFNSAITTQRLESCSIPAAPPVPPRRAPLAKIASPLSFPSALSWTLLRRVWRRPQWPPGCPQPPLVTGVALLEVPRWCHFMAVTPPHPSLSPPGAAGAFSLVRPPLPVAVPLRETFLYLYIKKNPGEKKKSSELGGSFLH